MSPRKMVKYKENIKNLEMVDDKILIYFEPPEQSPDSNPQREDMIGEILAVGNRVKDFKSGDIIPLPPRMNSGLSSIISFNGITYYVVKEEVLYGKFNGLEKTFK